MTKQYFIHIHCKQRVPASLWLANPLLTPLIPRIETKGIKLWELSSVILTPPTCESWILGFTSRISTFVVRNTQQILEMCVLILLQLVCIALLISVTSAPFTQHTNQ